MSQFKNAKITDKYNLSVSTNYVGSDSEDEITLGEALGLSKQSELDKLLQDDEHEEVIEEALNQALEDHVANTISSHWNKA